MKTILVIADMKIWDGQTMRQIELINALSKENKVIISYINGYVKVQKYFEYPQNIITQIDLNPIHLHAVKKDFISARTNEFLTSFTQLIADYRIDTIWICSFEGLNIKHVLVKEDLGQVNTIAYINAIDEYYPKQDLSLALSNIDICVTTDKRIPHIIFNKDCKFILIDELNDISTILEKQDQVDEKFRLQYDNTKYNVFFASRIDDNINNMPQMIKQFNLMTSEVNLKFYILGQAKIYQGQSDYQMRQLINPAYQWLGPKDNATAYLAYADLVVVPTKSSLICVKHSHVIKQAIVLNKKIVVTNIFDWWKYRSYPNCYYVSLTSNSFTKKVTKVLKQSIVKWDVTSNKLAFENKIQSINNMAQRKDK